MSKDIRSKVLKDISLSELKGILSLVEAGCKSQYYLDELKAEIKFREDNKQIDEIFDEAKNRFGSTLTNLKD